MSEIKKRIIRGVAIILWLGLPIMMWLVMRSSTQLALTGDKMIDIRLLGNEVINGWVTFVSLGYVGMLWVFTIMSRKNEEGIMKKEDTQETPIWKEPPFIFAILLFPSIFLLCLIFYRIDIWFH